MDRKTEDLLDRTIAGKFRIESYIGGGAMGAVYKARQLALDKTVAIKVLHEDHARDPTFSARFHREAKAASRLDHPNSLRVIDFGEDAENNVVYIAMEYLGGRDLFKVLQQDWPIPPERIVDILSQTLAALSVAHDLGIVHRDLKPENIMVLDGTDDEGNRRDVVKVCDFGIAKLTDAREKRGERGGHLTTQGVVVGTPEYMSPEQAKGEPVDARSNLYAMGVILYQLLTRRVPFEGETAIAVVLKHVTEDPPPPSSVNALVNPRLEAICRKALSKKPDDRFPSARAMRTELRGALGLSLPGTSRETSMAPSSVGSMATANTVHALDSLAIAQSMAPLVPATPTASKITPGATVRLGPGAASPRRSVRPLIVAAGLALTLGVGGTVAVVTLQSGTDHPDPRHGKTAGSSSVATSAAASAVPSGDHPGTADASAIPPEPVESSSATVEAGAPPEEADAEPLDAGVSPDAQPSSDAAVAEGGVDTVTQPSVIEFPDATSTDAMADGSAAPATTPQHPPAP